MQELQNFRNQIDKIDSEIIELLSQRFEIVKKVWEFKKENNIIPLQPWRWQEVLNSRILQAKEKWLKENLVESIWNEIHKYALDLEK